MLVRAEPDQFLMLEVPAVIPEHPGKAEVMNTKGGGPRACIHSSFSSLELDMKPEVFL